ncbi:copper homeostasis protein CutC [Rhizobium sp. CECT 9324]|uniref:copper homeostasis protein CutC n=1 Tax=Rhizobium sp. CECT 9324 TaxID=2845820 RepID=UPI000DDF6F74|nr:copper homeostasis protein CutC [Rhizobium sp. CECT 9324]CAH0342021.1 Copper homeostasis protein CutC [Rhizobium sp. CECT 9324]
MQARILEVCVDDADGLAAAIAGGADRIELCSALGVGGLTPTRGFMALAAKSPIPVNAIIRPRIGGFAYSDDEISIMLADIEAACDAGLAGVVIGALRPDGTLDRAVLERLIKAAGTLDLTLHRAFDMVPDFDVAVEMAIDLGFSRVLTSGGARHAEAGLPVLRRVAEVTSGRISIMPGGGVRPGNAADFLAIPGVFELHASCTQPMEPNADLVDFGFSPTNARRTDADTVRQMKAILA